MRILFAINGDQDVGAIDLFFSRRLNVQDGPLNDSLEPERRRVSTLGSGGVCSISDVASAA